MITWPSNYSFPYHKFIVILIGQALSYPNIITVYSRDEGHYVNALVGTVPLNLKP